MTLFGATRMWASHIAGFDTGLTKFWYMAIAAASVSTKEQTITAFLTTVIIRMPASVEKRGREFQAFLLWRVNTTI